MYPLKLKSNIAGIYSIRNIDNGKLYIGSSSRIKYRVKDHRDALLNGDHHSSHLQKSWNKYGENKFIFEVIEIITLENSDKTYMLSREQYWIDYLKTYNRDFGYNMSPSATNPNLGIKRSEETKQKLRDAWVERKIKYGNLKFSSDDRKIAMISRKTRIEESGFTDSELEGRKKMIEKKTGIKQSPEAVLKRNEAVKKIREDMKLNGIESWESGRKWYNNGVKSFFIKDDVDKTGLIPGRIYNRKNV